VDDGGTQGAIDSGFPLVAAGAFKGSRVGLLRGYGNAICPPLAAAFVRECFCLLEGR
jgi:hypothetical protein